MRGEWAAAERVEEVRAAATGWKRAGAIDEGTFEEISRRYPEPRTRPGPLWRVLSFLLASAILLLGGAALFVAASPRSANAWILCGVLGTAFIAVAEIQARSPAMALRGGVEAASFWGVVALVAGLFSLFEENLHLSEPAGPNLVLAGAAALMALGAWRWGNPAFAGFAAGAGFVLLARAPHGRLLWVTAGVVLAAIAERFLDRPSWAPSHRACAGVLAVCGVAAVYGAVNLWSLDRGTIEIVRSGWWTASSPSSGERIAAGVATALVPLLVFVRGLRTRRTVLLDAGLVLGALSLVTLRHYVHVAELWVVLTGAGAALALAALAVNRRLRRGPHGERGGFTADPLFADESAFRAAELVPVLAAHAPAARPPDEPGFSAGGGSFGGGGAGGSF